MSGPKIAEPLGADGTPLHDEWPRWYARFTQWNDTTWNWHLLAQTRPGGRKVLVAQGDADSEDAALEAARGEQEKRRLAFHRAETNYEVEL